MQYLSNSKQLNAVASNYTFQIAYMPLLTIGLSNFALQTSTNIEFIFEFLHTFQPSHSRKLETEMILAAFNNIYITGFK